MTEHPILFSAPMVRAILEGRKTMTRRVVKSQPSSGIRWGFSGWEDGHGTALRCPYGQPGDRLWVRETWEADDLDIRRKDKEVVEYRATSFIQPVEGWIPSIFMPRWASRILLEVTDIRVERVQDITEGDAKAEGTTRLGLSEVLNIPGTWVGAFADLWDSINAKRGYGWDANPWVWVVSFKRIEASI